MKNKFIEEDLPKIKELAEKYKKTIPIATIKIINIIEDELCDLIKHINQSNSFKMCSYTLGIIFNNKSKSSEKVRFEKLAKGYTMVVSKNALADYFSKCVGISEFIKHAGNTLSV